MPARHRGKQPRVNGVRGSGAGHNHNAAATARHQRGDSATHGVCTVNGWAHAAAPSSPPPSPGSSGSEAGPAAASDDEELFSLEYLLTGPHASFFHAAAAAAAIALYVQPKVSPRVWNEDAEMRPGTWLQELLWHVSDELQAVGFEAAIAGGLVAAVASLAVALALRVRAESAVPAGRGASATPDNEAGSPSPDDGDGISEDGLGGTAGEGAGAEEEEEPPYLVAAAMFAVTVALLVWWADSPLNYSPPPLTVHANVVGENERIRQAIAALEQLAVNATTSDGALEGAS